MKPHRRDFYFHRIFLASCASMTLLVGTHRYLPAGLIAVLSLAAMVITWPRERMHITSAVRQQVFARDGHRCQWFFCKNRYNLHIDHMIPISKGGRDRMSNYLTMCGFHNRRKSNRIVPSLLVWVGVKRMWRTERPHVSTPIANKGVLQ